MEMHRAMDLAAAADCTLHCALALRLDERSVLSFSGVVALCFPFSTFGTYCPVLAFRVSADYN
jgi:hypothetical protein